MALYKVLPATSSKSKYVAGFLHSAPHADLTGFFHPGELGGQMPSINCSLLAGLLMLSMRVDSLLRACDSVRVDGRRGC